MKILIKRESENDGAGEANLPLEVKTSCCFVRHVCTLPMAFCSWLTNFFSYFWPSSSNDLVMSKRLLQALHLQPSTKHFTLALRDPQYPDSVLYILCSSLLSQQSATDARDLINAVSPSTVIVQVHSNAGEVIQMEHYCGGVHLYPESTLHIIKESFHNNNIHAKYMKLAQEAVIRAIFGTSFMDHIVAAKQTARKVNSSFYYLECPPSPAEMSKMEESQDVQDPMMAAKHISSSLGSPFFSFSVSKFNETSMYVSQMKFMRNFSLNTAFTTHPAITQFFAEGQVCYPNSYTAYECPEFAQAIYPFLIELYCAFRHLPGMHLALQETQKLLLNVRNGGAIDHSCLSVCQCFRLGAEALRSALNDSAHAPLELDKFSSSFVPFEELPYEDVCYVVLAQALKEQLQKSHRVVAILDAGMVAGVRKYWTSTVPDHVKALATECLILDSEESPNSEEEGSEGSMLDKPLIIVGAGAATLVGVTSSVHWGSASTAMKMFSFKIPTALKLAFIGAKKGSISSVIKAAHPITSSVFPSGKAFSAAKYAAGFKASVFNAVSGSANTRVAAHSVISTAQRVSLSAIRTTFYHVMQNRHRKGVGPRLWLSFGASVTACAGVLMFGEKFENVIEIVPEASSISSLCKGLNNLSHASNALMQIKDNQ